MKRLILLITILLLGCTRTEYITEYINQTIYINNTINKTVEIPCNATNVTCQECPEYNKSRELELIRRISFLEGQQDKYFNDSECNWELNRTENELEECQNIIVVNVKGSNTDFLWENLYG